MAAAITLADGRCMSGSNLGVSCLFWLIGNETCAGALKTWLLDMSERPGGFLDFDLRGLTPSDQEAFWSAAKCALDKLAEKHGPAHLARVGAYGANCLARLLEFREKEMAGEPPLSLSDYSEVLEWDGEKVNFSDLWVDVNSKNAK